MGRNYELAPPPNQSDPNSAVVGSVALSSGANNGALSAGEATGGDSIALARAFEGASLVAGGIAHHFNNLLTVIIGNVDLMEARLGVQSLVAENLSAIRAAGVRAAALTRQLLDFSGKSICVPRPIDLNALIAEARGALHRVLGRDVVLTLRFGPEPARIVADPDQFRQILEALALNASAAMPRGGRLEIETCNADPVPGRFVLLSVTDTGCGMAPEVRARVFDPFFSTKGTAAGLGLSAVYGAVRRAGGHVHVTSEPGRGTTVQLYWPCAASG
jgi:signal transduction histidine kinase